MKSLKIFLLAISLLVTSVAGATTVRSMNIQELVSDAQYIIKAKVIDKTTAVDSDESGYIVTYYTVSVSEWIKGNPSPDGEMVFKQIAQGEYTLNGNTIRQKLFFPEYQVGQTYVFFLPEAHEKTGMLAPVGLYQGVYNVVNSNGVETIPQLKNRNRHLKARLDATTSKNKYLLFNLNATNTDTSYEQFKTIIESAK